MILLILLRGSLGLLLKRFRCLGGLRLGATHLWCRLLLLLLLGRGLRLLLLRLRLGLRLSFGVGSGLLGLCGPGFCVDLLSLGLSLLGLNSLLLVLAGRIPGLLALRGLVLLSLRHGASTSRGSVR